MIRGLLTVIGFLVAGAIVVGIMCSPFILVNYWAKSTRCHAQWDRSGMPAQYTYMGGCMVQRADTTWVPASALRDLN